MPDTGGIHGKPGGEIVAAVQYHVRQPDFCCKLIALQQTYPPEKQRDYFALAYVCLGDAYVKNRDQGLEDVASVLLEDDPGPAILDYAKTHAIDLVVIGSRGYGDIKSLFLGSVSHKVVEGCEFPCLVVK